MTSTGTGKFGLLQTLISLSSSRLLARSLSFRSILSVDCTRNFTDIFPRSRRYKLPSSTPCLSVALVLPCSSRGCPPLSSVPVHLLTYRPANAAFSFRSVAATYRAARPPFLPNKKSVLSRIATYKNGKHYNGQEQGNTIRKKYSHISTSPKRLWPKKRLKMPTKICTHGAAAR